MKALSNDGENIGKDGSMKRSNKDECPNGLFENGSRRELKNEPFICRRMSPKMDSNSINGSVNEFPFWPPKP